MCVAHVLHTLICALSNSGYYIKYFFDTQNPNLPCRNLCMCDKDSYAYFIYKECTPHYMTHKVFIYPVEYITQSSYEIYMKYDMTVH